MKTINPIILFLILFYGCSEPEKYDVLIKNGRIVDGSGSPSYIGDIGINEDTIAKIGDLKNASDKIEIDAKGVQGA